MPRPSARRGEALAALLMLSPVLLAVAVLRLWPALIAVRTSLAGSGTGRVGLSAYRALFGDPTFVGSLLVTAVYSVIVNPLQIGAALLLALLLAGDVPLAGLWRSLLVLPVVVPQSVSAVIWGIAFRPDGLVNGLLKGLGLPGQPFLTSVGEALPSIMVIVSWVGVGYWMTFLVAGLQDVPRSLHEAARLDGASAWQDFRFVTLPLLRRPLLFVIVADTVSNFLVFAPVQILTGGGPQGSTNLVMEDIYTRAFVYGDVQGAAVETVVLVLAVLLVVLVQFRLMRAAS